MRCLYYTRLILYESGVTIDNHYDLKDRYLAIFILAHRIHKIKIPRSNRTYRLQHRKTGTEEVK